MAYTINLTDGTVFATIADGTINTSSSMTLVGKNYAGYGEFLDENFIHLLENGSNTTAPSSPLTGQLWWDKTNNLLKVYNGTIFKTISAATASASQPTSNVTGDLWYDTTNQQLKVYTGASFIVVGPAFTSSEGTAGAIPATVLDSGASPHFVTWIYVNNQQVAVFSKDPAFTPAAPTSTNYPVIYPGITVTKSAASVLAGNVVNAGNLTLGASGATTVTVTSTGANVTGYLTSSGNVTGGNIRTVGLVSATGNVIGGNVTTTGLISASGNITSAGNVDAAYFIGNGSQLTGLSSAVSVSKIVNGTTEANAVSSGGNIAFTIGGTSNVMVVSNSGVTATGISVPSITKTGANAVGNIGSASNYFNQVFATATTALYADVAERFEADEALEPGTVVELGGLKEITRSQQELSENVFGVISTRPAYTMNGGAGDDTTHPPVAMTGRVPVKVTGTVRKGDRLVSAGQGLARAALPGEATPFNVIGRSLIDKNTTDVGTVEAIVTIK